MTETKANPNSIPRLTAILLLVAAVTSLLLGLVNMVTEDRIDAIKAAAIAAAMEEVLPSPSYTAVDYTGDNPLVIAVYTAGDRGHVVEVMPSGFGGGISMVVGVDSGGAVSGLSITSMSETSGLGTEAQKPEYRAQYVGGSGPFAVDKDGGKIDSLTGATVTSRAVTDGVNAALEAVKSLG